MKIKKQILAISVFLILVAGLGCISSAVSNNSSQSNQNSPSPTKSTSQWTPSSWVAYNGDLTLGDPQYIGDIKLTHTAKIIMQLNIMSGANSISYLAVIPASELEKWKENSPSVTYEFSSYHAKSGTYTTTLSPGAYYVLVGIADPTHQTLAEGTEVIDAGKYTAIPIDLTQTLYSENIKASIDIRENLDITLDFMRSSEFQVYQEGGTPRVVASYRRAESGTYDITNGAPSYLEKLNPDVYYLILDNGYSWFTKKTVDYKVTGDVVYPAEIHLTVKVKETS